MEVRYEMTEQW